MQINSIRFGAVEINEDSIIGFPCCIPGFPELKQFAIIRCEQTEPIQWFQSIEDENVVLPVINPFVVKADYDIEVNDEELDIIGTHNEEDLVIVNVMVLPEDLSKMTINLMAPILINIKKMLGCQVMMDHKDYDLHFPAYQTLMEYYKKENREENGNVGADKKD